MLNVGAPAGVVMIVAGVVVEIVEKFQGPAEEEDETAFVDNILIPDALATVGFVAVVITEGKLD